MEEYVVRRWHGGQPQLHSEYWQQVQPLSVNRVPWPGYAQDIHTWVRLALTDTGILVRFETDEKPLQAQNNQLHSRVWQDSCMEFFFRSEKSLRYVNIEINPLGAIYADLDEQRLEVDAQMLQLVSLITPQRWYLQYEVPFTLLEACFGPIGNCLYANFYKCGDLTEHPHYFCWNELDTSRFDFHQPENFGKLILCRE